MKICRSCSKVKKSRSLFIGDSNFSDIYWQHLSSDTICSKDFFEIVQECFMVQYVDFPTRVESNTMLDLVHTLEDGLVLSVEDVGKPGSSDHSILEVLVAGNLLKSDSSHEVLDWSKADIAIFKEELLIID